MMEPAREAVYWKFHQLSPPMKTGSADWYQVGWMPRIARVLWLAMLMAL